jgi:5-methyltetrahydrofolate--homocysteine methyltransferase
MDPLRRVSPAQKFALARQLRLNPTPGERHAWSLLRNRGVLGLKFRRQYVLHGFIVDFYCVAEQLVVELEGDIHDASGQRSYDDARAAFLEAAGYRVIRIRNREVTRRHLERLLRERLRTSPIVPPLPKGEGVRG